MEQVRNSNGATILMVLAPHVRGVDEPTSQDVCINLLFTHTELQGGVGGTAVRGNQQDNYVGGICDHRLL